MRVTSQVKEETRKRILQAAQQLFRTKGFEQATTRDLAAKAGIATGTLFNYFPTKESIVLTFVDDALSAARESWSAEQNAAQTLEESLFAFVATGLRGLRPFRGSIRPLLDACLNPLTDDVVAERIRQAQLEAVVELLRQHGVKTPPSPVTLHLFWTLYTGVLSFWATDASPHQEDTLGLLDQSTRMFVNWIHQSPD